MLNIRNALIAHLFISPTSSAQLLTARLESLKAALKVRQ